MASLDNNNDSDYRYYSKLIEKYKDMAYTIALKITGNEQDSEEIVQDSFVKMFQGLNKFKNESKFSTWFYRIVYNTSISFLRNRRIKTVDIESVFFDKSLIYSLDNTIQNLNQQDRSDLIQTAMNKLGELDYTILTLYYFENKSLKEIARITGENRGYLKVLLQRARIKLYGEFSHSLKTEIKELL
jgi:RNA polymerase sigma factor (sigma-70 family)